ncbi:hypothetical protein [Aquimarina sp. MMG016]|uniref:hypothetical protein n=1 Tax=Aquimarina sp. MMG016 TaxID=2822690 RepID=UPI001B39DB1F|nr:hypothetical protein [Aquimarina sp. MMG016]MBQ4822467.1 hypothetical protein [Aquimarina sp. MMG016]
MTLLFISSISFAQRIKIDKKQLAFLKEETKIGVLLTFPEDFVMDGSRIRETDFLFIKEETWNERIPPDGGRKWLEAYETSKKEDWVNAFVTAFNETIAKHSNLRFTPNTVNTNYTIIVEADWIYMGYNGGIIAQRAKLVTTLRFVKSQNIEDELYSTTTPVIRGGIGEGVFNDLCRVKESYDMTGYILALQLKKVLK